MLTHTYFKKFVTLLLLAGACNPENSGTSDTDDTTGDSTGGSTGGASSTTGEMSTTDATSSSAGSTGEAMTTGASEATTTEGDPTEAGTTGGSVDPSTSCAAYCEHAAECGVESDAAECVAACTEDFEELLADLMGQCGAENEAVLHCAAALSCEELAGDIETGPCGDELAAFDSCFGIEPESGALP